MALVYLPSPLMAQVHLTPITTRLSNPVFVGHAGDGSQRLFIVEQDGIIKPWRFSIDRTSGEQWIGDVGQGEREEIDRAIVKGGNYGWRIYEGFLCTGLGPSMCNPSDYIDPSFDYSHTRGRCSVTGGCVYRGSRGTLPGGVYVYGDFCSGEIFATGGDAQGVLVYTTMNIS
jgi:hypothetical protein